MISIVMSKHKEEEHVYIHPYNTATIVFVDAPLITTSIVVTVRKKSSFY